MLSRSRFDDEEMTKTTSIEYAMALPGALLDIPLPRTYHGKTYCTYQEVSNDQQTRTDAGPIG